MPKPDIFDILLILSMGVMVGLIIDTAMGILIDECMYGTSKFTRFVTLTYFKCCAFLFRKKIIMLRNREGKVSLTLASKVNDELFGYCYYRHSIHPIALYQDGTVQHLTLNISYMLNWLPFDLEERTFMVLQGAKNFSY